LSNRFTSKNPSTPQGKRGRLRKKETNKQRISPFISFGDEIYAQTDGLSSKNA